MARRAAGTRTRADGTLEKRFTVDGKRYSVYGKTNKEIQEKETALRETIKAGTYCANRKITLDKYFDEWKNRKLNTVKESTVLNYSRYYKHISKQIGQRTIQNLERREILKMQETIKKDVSAYTANFCMTVLRTVLNEAMRDEIIVKNPAVGIKDLKDTKEAAAETIHRALSVEEQTVFMQEMKESENPYYEFSAFLLSTGMRTGEAAALQWGDIDYKNNVVHVRRTWSHSKDGKRILTSPKSAAGVRDIPITSNMRDILENRKNTTRKITTFPGSEQFIFLTNYDNVIECQLVILAINKTLESLEKKGIHIERFTPHAFRDTFATRFIEQGGNPQTLKTILGHSSLAMTMDLYAHVLPNTKQEEMDKINIAI